MMNQNSATHLFRAARDELLGLSGSYEKAVETFAWPLIDGPFNWAVDYFDAMARGNDACALWIVEEDGSEQRYSFDEMAHRSDQVAAWLAAQGVGRGDPVMLMLGNQVELWESMLAAMKLGAVIMPTASAAGSADLADRISRGGARWVITNAADAAKFDGVPGDYGKILVDTGRQAGAGQQTAAPGFTEKIEWLDYGQAYAAAPVQLQTVTDAADPLLFYFTSGTTSRPKLVEHTQVSYPVGHLSTMYFLGLQPGDIHLNISSPGWAKHAWSSFFAPWNAEATVFIYNYARHSCGS
jgi:acetyl-CoA synthetase